MNKIDAEINQSTSELLDRIAIRSTLEAYFSSVDRRDWIVYGQCFTDDARAEFNKDDIVEIVVGRDAIVKRAEQRRDRPISNHQLSNTHISIEGDRATAVTHAVAHLVVPSDGGMKIVTRGVVYEDELVAGADRTWQITKRAHRPIWQYEAVAQPLGY